MDSTQADHMLEKKQEALRFFIRRLHEHAVQSDDLVRKAGFGRKDHVARGELYKLMGHIDFLKELVDGVK